MIVQSAEPGDAAEILELQKLAYHSEAVIYNEFGIPPLIQTLDEMRADLARQTCLKATIDARRAVGPHASEADYRKAFRQNLAQRVGQLVVHPLAPQVGVHRPPVALGHLRHRRPPLVRV